MAAIEIPRSIQSRTLLTNSWNQKPYHTLEEINKVTTHVRKLKIYGISRKNARDLTVVIKDFPFINELVYTVTYSRVFKVLYDLLMYYVFKMPTHFCVISPGNINLFNLFQRGTT